MPANQGRVRFEGKTGRAEKVGQAGRVDQAGTAEEDMLDRQAGECRAGRRV